MERLTELEAINTMLLDIHMAPVATVDDLDLYHEASLARMNLVRKTRDVCARGYNFNTRLLTLSPDANGHIYVPGNTIDVFVPEGADEVIVVDNKLQDITTGSQIYTKSKPVYVVLWFDFAELPSVVQALALAEARVSFALSMRADARLSENLSNELHHAKTQLESWDSRQKRRNMLDNMFSRLHINRNLGRNFL